MELVRCQVSELARSATGADQENVKKVRLNHLVADTKHSRKEGHENCATEPGLG
jgi:hypothetical protein